VIGSKNLKEVWFRKTAQDYDMLGIFRCPSHYHVKEDELYSRAKKVVFMSFKRGVKGYNLCVVVFMSFKRGVKGYNLCDLTLKIVVSRDV